MQRRHLLFFIVVCMVVTSYLYMDIRKDGNKLQSHSDYYKKETECTTDYMSYDACKDSKLAADPSRSKIVLEGGPIFLLGERVRLNVKVFDGYNNPKSSGGDHLRARMTSTDKSSLGRVLDNLDGTYIIVFEALWTGTIQLEVELLYPREILSAVYRTRNMQGSNSCGYSKEKAGLFKRNSCVLKEKNITKNSKHVDKETNSCSFTIDGRENTFMHCSKPKDNSEPCWQWIKKSRSCWTMDHQISDCEAQLAGRKKFVIGGNISVAVVSEDNRQHMVDIPSVPCTKYNTTELWFREEPTGFFYMGNWILRHCRGGTTNIGMCLQNTTLFLFGDSTLYHWRRYIWQHLSINCITLEKGPVAYYAYQQWQDTIRCHCKEYNITIIWVPGHIDQIDVFGSYSKKFRHLDTVDRRYRLIVVVTVFLHLALYEFSRFRAHMLAIRTVFEEILDKFLQTKLLLKMPHTHRPFELNLLETNTMIEESDFVSYVYTCIIKEVFKGVYDKVIMLNNRDATIARKNKLSHPDAIIVANMVKQLMNYICFIPEL